MRSTQQLSITLPDDMAANVRAKVASGRYASESEVVREGLFALEDREHDVEHWLRIEVVEAYEALRADPTQALTIDEVRANLADEYDRAVGIIRE